MPPGNADDTDPCCKVGRVGIDYGLDDLDERLVREHDGGESLRSLAGFLNRELFASAVRSASVDTVEDPRSLYGSFVDEGDTGRRTELRARLERAGVDVEALDRDFVSHQAIKRHLDGCLGEDTGREGSITPESAFGVIDWTRSRTAAVVAEKLDRLRDAGHVAIGRTDVSVVVRVTCEDCGRTAHLRDVITGGGCGCSPPDGDGEGD